MSLFVFEAVYIPYIAVRGLSAIHQEIRTTDGHSWDTDKFVVHSNEKRYICTTTVSVNLLTPRV